MAEAVRPEFISRDPDQILSELITQYETETGRVLQPAQVERLILNAFAYRESLLRSAIQDAATQNLVAFASAPVLDYLGELVGVKRLAAVAATTTLRVTLVTGHNDVIIPAGTRVGSSDGKVVFSTDIDTPVSSSTNIVDISATCNVTGISGNGYIAGSIKLIIDPQPYISSITNPFTTSQGSDQESDDALRERIKIAPAAFSNAGSRGAYEYWAKSAHPAIVDVTVRSVTPGVVEIYPLATGGTTTAIINAVTATCNGEKVRPLTDTVSVGAPGALSYSIYVNIIKYTEADETTVQQLVYDSLAALAFEKAQKLGRDIVASQVIAACMVKGVYSATLVGWSDVICSEVEVSELDGIIINVTGSTNG